MSDHFWTYLILVAFAIAGIRHAFYKWMRTYDWYLWYNHIYLKSWHWQITRWKKKTISKILHRGKLFCENCGSEKYIQIHHISYKNLWHERLSDLQCICRSCHRRGSGKI